MLINKQAKIFMGMRSDIKEESWQMPQGGIDKGEEPLTAALRELLEETGIDQVKVLLESSAWYSYELPLHLQKGKYCGQKQKWFLMEFIGHEADICLDTPHPEFKAWQWIDPGQLTAMVVDFKREVYHHVLQEFLPWLERYGSGGGI